MKVLFIGGTGIISSACSKLAMQQGIDLFFLNRGKSSRPTPDGVKVIKGDIRDIAGTKAALADYHFDAIVNWITFTVPQVEADIELFKGKTNQYIFISSASAYQKPLSQLPIRESTPLHNPFWEYSRNKIACEERLTKAYREVGFPITIVRPSHTYDQTLLPLHGGYTVIDRMRKGLPVVMHGDGTSLWVMTHHEDFAKGFNGLLGNAHALGETFQITSDELLTWDQIAYILADASGVARSNLKLVHVPSEVINKFDPGWGAGLLGDKAHSVIFDNSKIKRLVPSFICNIPFSRGTEQILKWYDADASRRVVNEGANQMYEKILSEWKWK